MPDCDGQYEDYLNELDSNLTEEELDEKYSYRKLRGRYKPMRIFDMNGIEIDKPSLIQKFKDKYGQR